jgi:hypothetical protein
MAIINAQLPDTQLDLLTVPAGKTYAITCIMVCNTYSPFSPDFNTRSASFDMHFVMSGENIQNQRTIVVRELTLPAGETFTFDSEKIVLSAGDKLSFVAQPGIPGEAGKTDIAAMVSYLEV